MYNPFGSKKHMTYVDGTPFVDASLNRGNHPTGGATGRYINSDKDRWKNAYTSEHCLVYHLGAKSHSYGPFWSWHYTHYKRPVFCEGECNLHISNSIKLN